MVDRLIFVELLGLEVGLDCQTGPSLGIVGCCTMMSVISTVSGKRWGFTILKTPLRKCLESAEVLPFWRLLWESVLKALRFYHSEDSVEKVSWKRWSFTILKTPLRKCLQSPEVLPFWRLRWESELSHFLLSRHFLSMFLCHLCFTFEILTSDLDVCTL